MTARQRTGGSCIDRLEARCLMSRPVVAAAVAGAPLSVAATDATGALTVSLKVSSQAVHTAQPVSVTVTVTNSSTATQIGVVPSLSQNSGDLLFTKLASPSIASIAAGKSILFKFAVEELVVGSTTLTANAAGPYATSTGSVSAAMTTMPAKISKTAITDASGNAYLKIGANVVPVNFVDQSTGAPIAGLALSVASANKQNSRAVIVMGDSAGRYPTQMVVLEGASASSLVGSALLTAGGTATPTVDVGTATTAAVNAIQTTFLPPVTTTTSTGTIGTAFLAALKALPLPSVGNQPTKVLYSSKPIEVPELAQQVASTVTEFGLSSAATELIIATGLRLGEVAQPETIPIAEAAEVALMGGDLSLALGSNIYEETNVQAVQVTLVSSGGIPYFVFTPVPPPDAADITWTPKQAIGDVTIDPTNSTSQTYSGGSYELISNDDLGADIVGVLPDSGPEPVYLESGSYTANVNTPGFQPDSGSTVQASAGGGTVDDTLAAAPIASGTLTSALGQATGFLAAGTQYYLTPHFFDADGNALTVTGTGPYYVNGHQVIFTASNPVGANVVSVDAATGQVTMLSGFGAGLVTASCDGITTTAKLVSTNGQGKYPVQPKGSFAVNPGTLHFTAMEGGANPADQTYDIMPLSSSFTNYNYTTTNGWVSETPTNVNNYNIMDVSVDTSGLAAGTYSRTLTITDSNSHYRQNVIVTLTITPAPPATLSSGTYVGNWTYPVFGFGDDYTTLTFHLQQVGSKVTGDWESVVLDGSVDTTGQTQGDTFYQGSIIGNTITLEDNSLTTFIGTISGNTITGTSNYLQANSSFTVTGQG